MKKLPIGIQTFATLITQGFTYVDKTGHLFDMVNDGGRYFLSRPRRFGKSLTCSTLDAIFSGHKELCKGLAISKKNYSWPIRPIVRLDFAQIDHQTPEQLELALAETLNTIAKQNNITLESQLPKGKLA